ncbi:MAG: putative lipoprotein [Verrucomicrobiales bacterium]|nr:putative lipoprotein [Verrucomicrobiales bacterium]
MNTHDIDPCSTKSAGKQITSAVGLVALLASSALTLGCVVAGATSASLGSISSLSASSASSDANHHHHHSAFYNDVRESTATAVIAQVSTAEVLRSVSRAAKQHGISDWEAEQASYIALGEGLRQAGLTQAQAQEWISRLSPGNQQNAQLMLKAYQA